jgi:hypothetical protein
LDISRHAPLRWGRRFRLPPAGFQPAFPAAATRPPVFYNSKCTVESAPGPREGLRPSRVVRSAIPVNGLSSSRQSGHRKSLEGGLCLLKPIRTPA